MHMNYGTCTCADCRWQRGESLCQWPDCRSKGSQHGVHSKRSRDGLVYYWQDDNSIDNFPNKSIVKMAFVANQGEGYLTRE